MMGERRVMQAAPFYYFSLERESGSLTAPQNPNCGSHRVPNLRIPAVHTFAVTCRLQLRKFTPVSARSNQCTPVHEPSRTGFVHSREPA
jgi:hypothetical protein